MDAAKRAFLRQSSLRLHTVNRLAVLYAALLLGAFGLHKYCLGARREALLYLALSWTGVTVLSALADWVVLLRAPIVGQLFAQRRLLARHPADADVIERETWQHLGLSALVVGLAVAIWVAIGDGP